MAVRAVVAQPKLDLANGALLTLSRENQKIGHISVLTMLPDNNTCLKLDSLMQTPGY